MRVGSKPGAFLKLTLLLWHEECVTKRDERHKSPFHPGLLFFPSGYSLRGQGLLLKNRSYIELLLYVP